MADGISTLLSGAVGLVGVAGAATVGGALLRRRDPWAPGGHALTRPGHPDPLRPVLGFGFGGATVTVRPGPRDELYLGAGEPVPGRTLRRLVLRALAERVTARAGRLHRDQSRPFTLVVEFAGERDARTLLRAYLQLDRELRDHAPLLTRFDRGVVVPGAVTALIGGVDVRALLAGEPRRYAFADGTLDDVGSAAAPASLVPCLGEPWQRRFGWDGREPLTAVERHLLHGLVAEAHAEGRTVRLGGVPARPRQVRAGFLAELYAAGVDAIVEQDLPALARELRARPDPVTVPRQSVTVKVNNT
jgi:hypothetical protein